MDYQLRPSIPLLDQERGPRKARSDDLLGFPTNNESGKPMTLLTSWRKAHTETILLP